MFIERITLISFNCIVLAVKKIMNYIYYRREKIPIRSFERKEQEGRENENVSQIVNNCPKRPLLDYPRDKKSMDLGRSTERSF